MIIDYQHACIGFQFYSKELCDFIYFFNLGKRYKEFEFRIGEYTWVACDGKEYFHDCFFDYKRQINLALGKSYYDYDDYYYDFFEE